MRLFKSPFRLAPPWQTLAAVNGLIMGCAGVGTYSADPHLPVAAAPAQVANCNFAARQCDGVRQVSTSAPVQVPPSNPPEVLPLHGMKELSADALVEQVLARNLSLAQMAAAWQAASARYPQVTSLDDPTFATTLAPGSIGNPNVNFGWRVEVSQKLPWPGKRELRGQAAAADADAAAYEFEDMRVQLAEAAKHAFAEYYLVGRALDVNAEDLRRLKEFRENAATLARTGRAPEQDFLQADVETGRKQERQLTLERMRDVAIARINTLMNVPTNQPLPPPPRELPPVAPVPPPEALQAAAANRPDLLALAERVTAAQAELAAAYKEYRPDFEVMAAYDAFWQAPQQALQPQVAVRMNVPLRRARRHAAVAEAEAKVLQRVADLEKQRTQVRLQVDEAYAQLREAERVVKLYSDSILPVADANVKAAQNAFVAAKTPFISLIEAQRSRVSLHDRYFEALADVVRRRATLERVAGFAPAAPK